MRRCICSIRNQAALAPFVAKGGTAHDSATRVADAARIVFACLPSGAISEAVARDVAAGSAVRLYVEMSTIGGPAQAKVQKIVEARGITLVGLPDQRWAEGRSGWHFDRDCRGSAGGSGGVAAVAGEHREDGFRGGGQARTGAVDEAGEQSDQRGEHGDGVRGACAGGQGRAGSGPDGGGAECLDRAEQRDTDEGAEGGAAGDVRLWVEPHDHAEGT